MAAFENVTKSAVLFQYEDYNGILVCNALLVYNAILVYNGIQVYNGLFQ